MIQQNANFNVTSVTDAAGAVQERYQYDPYGKATYLTANWGGRAGSDWGWTWLHQGGRYNAITKLYHFRFRDYTPDLGRWMQQDPAGYVDGASLYQAVGSAPIHRVDALGLWYIDVNVTVSKGVGGVGGFMVGSGGVYPY